MSSHTEMGYTAVNMTFAKSAESAQILHVDSDREMGNSVATLLERQNDEFTVTHESCPTEALESIRERPFDCIISDYDMPKMNGVEFLRRLRLESPDLPFILFTDGGREEVSSGAMPAGVTDYVEKRGGNDRFRILGNRVRNAVEKYRSRLDRQRGIDSGESTQDGEGNVPRGDMEDRPSGWTPCIEVIEAVAAREGVDPVDLTPPLSEAIDPEGLNAVCRGSPVRVTFEYHGYLVTIDGNGQVDLS